MPSASSSIMYGPVAGHQALVLYRRIGGHRERPRHRELERELRVGVREPVRHGLVVDEDRVGQVARRWVATARVGAFDRVEDPPDVAEREGSLQGPTEVLGSDRLPGRVRDAVPQREPVAQTVIGHR
jgi:hypothetical protein